jgi:mannitol-1-/sugar-/sorbitol-6-phosphatase
MFTLNCQAVLFDLDGTLVDSASRLQRLWKNWCARHDIAPESILEIMHGRRAGEIIQLVAPHLSIEEEVNLLETDEVSDMEGVNLYAGARELLSRLDANQWAVITSGSRRVAEARLNYLGFSLPGVFVTGDDVKIGKPAPDGYLLAAHHLHVKPENCVVVEDSPAGILAGKTAGMRVVAVATTHSWEQLYQADRIIQQLAEMSLNITGADISVQFKP